MTFKTEKQTVVVSIAAIGALLLAATLPVGVALIPADWSSRLNAEIALWFGALLALLSFVLGVLSRRTLPGKAAMVGGVLVFAALILMAPFSQGVG